MAMFPLINIENEALGLIKKVGAVTSPVDVREIATSQGLQIIEKDFKDELSAALLRKEKIIAVNKNHVATRQRFSIGHELGHWTLHASQNDFFDSVYKRESTPLRKNKSFEMEANQFAAALLMPDSLIKKAISETDVLESNWIERIANDFQVSKNAMTFRLVNLGYLAIH